MRRWIVVLVAGVASVLGALWLSWDAGPGSMPAPAPVTAPAREPADVGATASPGFTATAVTGSEAVPPPAPGAPGPLPRPEDGADGPAWRGTRLASGPRQLGKLGPYVSTDLEAAGGELAFCFGRAGTAAPPAAPEPALVQLYLVAREGALDVVDARVDRPGTLAPAATACALEVLRGREIRAFGARPGDRFRLAVPLEPPAAP